MNQFHILFTLTQSDLRERIRQPSFMVTLLVSLYLGYLYLPDITSGYMTVTISGTRGIYNSAWVGAVGSLMSSSFLSIIGFYLVKNAIERDRNSGVGQVLAATPITRFQYLLGKAVSNFVILAVIQGAIVVAVTAMQLVRGEASELDIIDLIAPSLLMVLPYLALVAAAAVIFEVVPFLRGALGNVIFFFLWMFILISSFSPTIIHGREIVFAFNDPAGVSQLMESMSQFASTSLGVIDSNTSIGVNIVSNQLMATRFTWPGMDWTIGIIAGRLCWFLVAFGLVGLAVPLFDRFGSIDLKKSEPNFPQSPLPVAEEPERTGTMVHLSALEQPLKVRLSALVRAELVLMWRIVGRWWFLGATAMSIVMLFVPISISRQWIWPLAWVWPLAVWSSLGIRERRFGTEQVLYSTSGGFQTRLAAIWLSGVAIAMFCGGGIAMRFLLAGDTISLLQWVLGALFIPTLALACGVWTSGTRLFEGVYIALWYIGPMNRAEPFDFMGVRPESWSDGVTGIYAAITVGLALLVLVGGKRQMRLDG